MAKASKLKVFRISIGFHYAYVAAPSQKAALEVWGSGDLFAARLAERVTEPELMDVPLARPGEVIKVLRGTQAEQVAALGEAAATRAQPAKKKSGSAAKAAKKEKPTRSKLDAAEQQVEALVLAQAKEMAKLEKELDAIERRRRQLERRQQRELGDLEKDAERERRRY